MLPFTSISGLIFISYLITDNTYIAAVSFNCATGVLLGFKSAYFIDPYGYEKCHKAWSQLHQLSPKQLFIIDFFTHIFPVLYLSYNYNTWFDLNIMVNALYLSLSIHLLWAYITCKGLNLNRFYLENCDYQMCDKQWHKLWSFTILGHFTSSIYHILYTEFT